MKAKTAREQKIINEYEEKIKNYNVVFNACGDLYNEVAIVFDELAKKNVRNAREWAAALRKTAAELKQD